MPNLRVAYAYDRKRYHPPEVSGKITTAICETVEEIFEDPHLLEIGAGTGRIGVPIIARGYQYTGVDTDPEMLELFRVKVAGMSRRAKLLTADAQHLPFPDATFDAVIAVQLWHLVPDIVKSINESIRVLYPGGFLFEGWDMPIDRSAEFEIQDEWCKVLAEQGYDIQPGAHQAALATAEKHLESLGFEPYEEVIAEWQVTQTVLEVVESLCEGLFCYTKNVPPDVRYRACQQVKDWAIAQYGGPDIPLTTAWAFHLRVSQLPF